ncbi:hypothetical protein BDQ17DRAFT_1422820 [Cyathus striatus]|nr:hypothetical protein BDQ17DRAFT_1422820 [Cyathus striatus]
MALRLVVYGNMESLRALYEIKRRVEEHAELVGRVYDGFENKLYRRWGKKQYKLDDSTCHRVVKPKFIAAFNSKKFINYCGKNPDFFIDDDGFVYPDATAAKQKKAGKCNQTEFIGRTYDDLGNQLYRRWGKGEYKLDDDTYHRDVKPKFIAAFNLKKFID